MNQPKCFSDIADTCIKDVLKIFDVNDDPQIRGNNLIHGNDEGVPILMSLTVSAKTIKQLCKRLCYVLLIKWHKRYVMLASVIWIFILGNLQIQTCDISFLDCYKL